MQRENRRQGDKERVPAGDLDASCSPLVNPLSGIWVTTSGASIRDPGNRSGASLTLARLRRLGEGRLLHSTPSSLVGKSERECLRVYVSVYVWEKRGDHA